MADYRNPFKGTEEEAVTAATNILAVEYLVKTNDPAEYGRRINQLYQILDDEAALAVLYIRLSLNMHTSSLGAMITQGDYETQREELLHFLDNPYEWMNDMA